MKNLKRIISMMLVTQIAFFMLPTNVVTAMSMNNATSQPTIVQFYDDGINGVDDSIVLAIDSDKVDKTSMVLIEIDDPIDKQHDNENVIPLSTNIEQAMSIPANAVFLEVDIISTSRSYITSYPANGSFNMQGTTYFRGITNNSNTSNSNVVGTATYNISGRGFTRLTGTLGRHGGTERGTLTVTAGDGRLLGGYVLEVNSEPIHIDIVIPSDVTQINIRLQPPNGNNRLGFADAYFSNSAQNLPQLEPPTIAGAVYLESDIISTSRSSVNRYPAEGTFRMHDTTYFRGITNNSSTTSSNVVGTATYNISGRGFTRLTGTLGRHGGTERGTLIVTAGDGRLLGGYILEVNSEPILIDIGIPSDVTQINIRLQPPNGNNRLGFADAYFSNSTQNLPQLEPPTIAGAVYLESDIISTSRSYVNRYPAEGSFRMHDTTYFRGITNNSSTASSNVVGTATYNISGRGFTRLAGTLGRHGGTERGTLTVTAGDGRLLGGYVLEVNAELMHIDVVIPSDVTQINIRLQPPNGNNRLGFADAYFSNSTSTVNPTPSAVPTPTVNPTPSADPTPTVDPTPSAVPTPTVDPTPSAAPTPTVDPTPTAVPTPTVDPTPSADPTPTPTISPDLVQAFVTRIYQSTLEREPDQEGLDFWSDGLRTGVENAASIIDSFFFSMEFLSKDVTDEQFVTIAYYTFMDRDPDEGGFNHWINALKTTYNRRHVIDRFLASEEFANICVKYEIELGPVDGIPGFVARMFRNVLGRRYDQGGLDFWVDGLLSGHQSGATIVERFFFSDEFVINRNVDNETFLTIAYNTLVSRDPDEKGFDYWLHSLNNGSDRREVLANMIGSQEFNNICEAYGIYVGALTILTQQGAEVYTEHANIPTMVQDLEFDVDVTKENKAGGFDAGELDVNIIEQDKGLMKHDETEIAITEDIV